MARRGRSAAIAAGVAGAVGAVGAATWAVERQAVRRMRRTADPDRGRTFEPPFDERHHLAGHDGGTIHAISRGEGPVVLLSHGVTLSVRTWVKQLERLPEQGLRVVAFDHRGHGASTVGDTGHAIENLAWDVRTVLEGLDLRDAVVVGHSMGGIAVQAFVTTFPEVARERLRGMVLLSTLARAPLAGNEGIGRLLGDFADRSPDLAGVMRRPDIGFLLSRIGFGRDAWPSHVELTRQMIVDCAPDTRHGATRALLGMDLTPRLAEIDLPTLVIAGTADLITPPAESRRIARRIPGARLELVPGGGHMLMLERPDLVDGLIRDFVAELAAAADGGELAAAAGDGGAEPGPTAASHGAR